MLIDIHTRRTITHIPHAQPFDILQTRHPEMGERQKKHSLTFSND